jgi:hypothetical protein
LGAFCVDDDDGSGTSARPLLRPPDRPAIIMVLAPVLGLMIWVGLFAMLV